MSNKELFLETYRSNLLRQKEIFPEKYYWEHDEFDVVYGKMEGAILRGSYSKDSDTFKLTCKKLNIKHTYKAINEFINS